MIPERDLVALVSPCATDTCVVDQPSVIMTPKQYATEVDTRRSLSQSALILAWFHLCRSCSATSTSEPSAHPPLTFRVRPTLGPRSMCRAPLFERHCEARASLYASVPDIRDQISRVCELVLGARAQCSEQAMVPLTYRIRFSVEPQNGASCSAAPVPRVFIVARSGSVYQSFEAEIPCAS